MKGNVVSLGGKVGEVVKGVAQLHVGQITRTPLFLLRTFIHNIQTIISKGSVGGWPRQIHHRITIRL